MTLISKYFKINS